MPYRRKRKFESKADNDNTINDEPPKKRPRYQTRSVTKAATNAKAAQVDSKHKDSVENDTNDLRLDWKLADFVWACLDNGGFSQIYQVFEIESLDEYAIKEIVILQDDNDDSDENIINDDNEANDNTFAMPDEINIHQTLKLSFLHCTAFESVRQSQLNLFFVALIMNAYRHKNVIDLKGFFCTSNAYYSVLELAQYGSLFYQRKQRPMHVFSEAIACFYLKQVINGLIYLHNSGIIHRDIKESNILICEDNVAKICDFGISVRVDDWTSRRYRQSGTVHYIAPEIVNKQPYNQNVDIYSLGVMLFVMLVGCYPDCETCGLNNAHLSMSYQALWLVIEMMQDKPTDRISLKNILKNEWFKKHEKFAANQRSVFIPESSLSSSSNCVVSGISSSSDDTGSVADIAFDSIEWGSVDVYTIFPHVDSMPNGFGPVDNYVAQEEQALADGHQYYQQHGYRGSIWVAIKNNRRFGSKLSRRKSSDLRGKWRRIQDKQKKQAQIEKKTKAKKKSARKNKKNINKTKNKKKTKKKSNNKSKVAKKAKASKITSKEYNLRPRARRYI